MEQEENKKICIYPITYSYIIVTLILVYCIIVPILLINKSNNNILDDLFIKSGYKNIIISFMTTFIILNLTDYLPKYIPTIIRRTIVIIIYNIILKFYINITSYNDGIIKIYKNMSTNFGWLMIIWDLIYINLIGELANKIKNVQILYKKQTKLSIFGLIVLFLLHV